MALSHKLNTKRLNMKISVFFSIVVMSALLSSQVCVAAGGNRSVCKKYFSNMNLSNCMVKQDAAQRQLESGVYVESVVKTCIDSNKLVDRKAYYIDYMGAERCAQQEQARRDTEFDKRKDESTRIINVN